MSQNNDNTADECMDQLNGNTIDDNEEEDNEEEDEDDDESTDEDTDADQTEGDDNDNEKDGSDDSDTDVDDDEDTDIDDSVDLSGVTNGDSSAIVDSDDDPSAPICHICLNVFAGQDIGSPDSCYDLHHFCLECIEEWSKQINTCPVDRNRFTMIYVRRDLDGIVIMKIPVVQNVVPDADAVPEDVTYCEICGRCDREDRLLLCDGCDFGYHCECLSPPIETIPVEEWFCPDCFQRLFGQSGDPLAERRRQRRAIARTGASEAVRQRILQRRQPNGATVATTAAQRKPRTTAPKRRKRRSTKRRTRKTTKRRKTKASTTKKSGTIRRKRRTKKRRKKRRTKKSAFASRRLPAPADARTRIASKLGIGPPPKSPYGLPSMKNAAYESIRKINDLRSAAGISNLSMFGSELDTYDPRVQMLDDDPIGGDVSNGNVGVMARSRLSANRLIMSPLKRNKSILIDDEQVFNGQSVDLLSSIMSSQTLLHSSSRDVVIGRDGSLHRFSRQNSTPLPVRNCVNSGGSSSGQSSPDRRTSPPQTGGGGSAPATTVSSPTHSASGSPERTDTTTASNNSYNYSFGGTGSDGTGIVSGCEYEDIGAIKPIPVRSQSQTPIKSTNATDTEEDDSKLELYSDIESIGGSNREEERESDGGDDNKQLVIDEPNEANDEKAAQSTGDSGNNGDSGDEQESHKPIERSPNSPVADMQTLSQEKPSVSGASDKPNNATKLATKATSKGLKAAVGGTKQRRRTSMKDLFGDSDDDDSEDDSDIRRLLAEQGSINVHYPIKIPIVLKKSINKSDSNTNETLNRTTSDAITDLVENTPPVDLNKWIVVTPVDSTTTTTTGAANKWKSIDNSVDNVVTNELSMTTSDETIKWKSIEKPTNEWSPIDESMDKCDDKCVPIDDTPIPLTATTTTDRPSDERLDVELDEQLNESMEQLSSGVATVSAMVDEEEGEIKEEDKHKVRRCRHGRIRRQKPKDSSGSRDRVDRHRSRSGESKTKHKDNPDQDLGNNDSNTAIDLALSSDVLLSSPLRNVEFKEKTFEPKSDEVVVAEGEDNSAGKEIGWKKLSTTTKMRSYRDGKPKDASLLFREREVSKRLVKKSTSKTSGKESVGDKHRHHDRRPKDNNVVPISTESGPHHCRKHRALAEAVATDRSDGSRGRSKRKADDLIVSGSDGSANRKRTKTFRSDGDVVTTGLARKSGEDDRHKAHKHHKSSRHKHSSDRNDSAPIGGRHSGHRSSKHSHHSSSKSKSSVGADSDTIVHMMGSSGGQSSVGPTKILRDHSSYADITPLDSKEIYAEGDRIVINVNFKRDGNSGKSRHQLQDTDGGDEEIDNEFGLKSGKRFIGDELSQLASNSGELNITSKRLSTKKDDSIYWASPPPPATGSSGGKTMTTSITRVIDPDYKPHNRSDRNRSDTDLIGDDLPRFLPRSLGHQSAGSDNSGQSNGPHTPPEGDYCEDQFMPTPTQDESLSPRMSRSTSRSSPMSSRSSPGLSNGAKDDVYDPEAPLQSPPQHSSPQIHKKPVRPDPKSPSPEPQPIRIEKQSKRTPPSMSASNRDFRRQPIGETKSSTKYSSKDMPKSSASHSQHSPFKSPSLLPHRQHMKPSPQKSGSQSSQQKSSSSQLMPPPLPPTGRPIMSTNALAAIAKINPQNLAQLLKMAQTLNSAKNSAKLAAPVVQSHHHRQGSQRQDSSGSSASNHNKDHNEVVDMDVESPSPPQSSSAPSQQPRVSSTTGGVTAGGASVTVPSVKTLWDQIIKSTTHSQSTQMSLQKRLQVMTGNTQSGLGDPKKASTSGANLRDRHHNHHRHQVVNVTAGDGKKPTAGAASKLDQLTVVDDVPSSAVEMAVKDKFIKKLNRQERVIEEVKLVLKPHYQKRSVTKDEYKEILRKSVPKICHSRSGEINPLKIKSLVEGYIKRYKYLKKKSKKLPKK